MRFVVAALAYLAALAVVAPVVLLAVLVLVVPAPVSRGVWRRK